MGLACVRIDALACSTYYEIRDSLVHITHLADICCQALELHPRAPHQQTVLFVMHVLSPSPHLCL
jgi:hypothetical protein